MYFNVWDTLCPLPCSEGSAGHRQPNVDEKLMYSPFINREHLMLFLKDWYTRVPSIEDKLEKCVFGMHVLSVFDRNARAVCVLCTPIDGISGYIH